MEISCKKLRVIDHPKGSIRHALKSSDAEYVGFGEVYFSEIEYCKIKAWKKHIKMKMNLVVPVGLVKFVFYEEKEKFFQEFILGLENYCRLSVPPGIWFGFKGMDKNLNLVMNISDLEHDPNEVQRKDISEIVYEW